jgi:hypothetical protein
MAQVNLVEIWKARYKCFKGILTNNLLGRTGKIETKHYLELRGTSQIASLETKQIDMFSIFGSDQFL